MEESVDVPSTQRRGWWYLLLLVPFIVLSILPYFNRVNPTFFGLPFFWWFQFLWVPVSAGLTAIVYFATEGRTNEGDPR